jgi:hypothetical protein
MKLNCNWSTTPPNSKHGIKIVHKFIQSETLTNKFVMNMAFQIKVIKYFKEIFMM